MIRNLLLKLTFYFLVYITLCQESNTIKDLIKKDSPLKSTLSFIRNWDRVIPSFEEYIKMMQDLGNELKSKSNKLKNVYVNRGEEDLVKEDIAQEDIKNNLQGDEITYSLGYSYRGPKDRFNYASKDCAANIMETNKGAKSASAILVKNKDRYLLDNCNNNRYVIIELCQEIEIQTVLLANFEFFSSTFKRFKLYASATYPPNIDVGWYFIGGFEALNIKNFQAFDVNATGYMKYLKIEVLSHYGDEHYCPISEIKVFGPTMLSSFINNPEDSDENSLNPSLRGIFQKDSEEGKTDTEADEDEDKEEINDTSEVIEEEKTDSMIFNLTKPTPNSFKSKSFDLPTTTCKDLSTNSIASDSCKRRLNHSFYFKPNISYAITPHDKLGFRRLFKHRMCNALISYTSSLKLNPNITTTKFEQDEPDSTSTNNIMASELVDDDKMQETFSEYTQNDNIKTEATSGEFATKSSSMAGNGPENVFRALTRRLNNLENNYQLLQAYIDNQATTFNNLILEIDQHQLEQFQRGFIELNQAIYLQFQQIRRGQEEVWHAIIRRMDNMNAKYKGELSTLDKKLLILSNEVMFGKRLQMAQLTILFIVVVVLLLAQLYNSSVNQIAYQHSLNNSNNLSTTRTKFGESNLVNLERSLLFDENPPTTASNGQLETNENRRNGNDKITDEQDSIFMNPDKLENGNFKEALNKIYPSPPLDPITERKPTPHPKYLDLPIKSISTENNIIQTSLLEGEENEDNSDTDLSNSSLSL